MEIEITEKQRDKAKICRHFSYELIASAMALTETAGGSGVWEEQEVIQHIIPFIFEFTSFGRSVN
jgi:hypothetical protein